MSCTRGYRTPAGKICCAANWVTASDLSSWFRVHAEVASVVGDVATVTVELSFRDVPPHGAVTWKTLRWDYLGEVHGRRIHASTVSTDLRAAWHVHPLDAADHDTRLTLLLRLPPREAGDDSALKVRMLLNFGVLADSPHVNLCVSEQSVHIDPAPGVEMVVEGQAVTQELTLRPGSGGAWPPLQPDLGATRAVVPLPLGGRGREAVSYTHLTLPTILLV